MAAFKTGDQVVHQVTQETGIISEILLVNVSTDVAEALVVEQDRGGRRVWLSHETDLLATTSGISST